MALQAKSTWQSVGIDKEPLRYILEELHKETSFEYDPDMTPEKLQQRMLAAGIRPEDDLASCGIIAARDED